MALYVQGSEKGGAKLTENILTNFDLNILILLNALVLYKFHYLIHKGQCLSVCVFSIEIQTAGRPMSGYPNMLELSIISYISILFLRPILNHPGQCRVTQASIVIKGKMLKN